MVTRPSTVPVKPLTTAHSSTRWKSIKFFSWEILFKSGPKSYRGAIVSSLSDETDSQIAQFFASFSDHVPEILSQVWPDDGGPAFDALLFVELGVYDGNCVAAADGAVDQAKVRQTRVGLFDSVAVS